MERIEIREDLDNLYNWDRIESTFETIDDVETLTRRFTSNDDGTSKHEDFSTSGPSVLYRDHPEGSGVRPWDSIEIRLNANLQRESRTIQFDDGTFQDEGYLNGVISFISQFDGNGEGNGVEPWSHIETGFDEFGIIEFRNTSYDDGTFRGEGYLNGVISGIFQQDGNGEGNGVEPWSHIETGFDENGQIEFRITYFDDGTFRGEGYLNGIISSISQEDGNGDDDGVEPWSYIETGFDENGQIEFRSTFYDDGTFRGEGYLNGVISSISQEDGNGEGNGVEPWSYIETGFDENGQIESRVTRNDDGTTREETYENGVLRQILQFDNPLEAHDGAERWYSIETRFDTTGQIESRGTLNDDGTTREETYENGTLRSIVQYDTPAESHDGIEPWSFIGTSFDENGQRTSKTVTNDDGSQKIETFQNGIRTRVEVLENRSDPATPQLTFSAEYDPVSGELLQRGRYDADGVTRTEVFEGGQRQSHTVTDSSNDLNPWQTIQTLYTDGALADRTTTYDNGDRRLETFSDNRLASILDSDATFLEVPPSACTFSGAGCPESPIALRDGIDQRETIFGDDGAITQRRTEYTDGDTTAALYENGRITQQHLVDGDNDQAWIARKILYNTDGSISDTIEFYSFDEIPTDFTLPVLMEDTSVFPVGIGPGGTLILDDLPVFEGDLFLFVTGETHIVSLATTGGTITVVDPNPITLGDITVSGGTDLDAGVVPGAIVAPLDDTDPTSLGAGVTVVTTGGLTLIGGGPSTVPNAAAGSIQQAAESADVLDFI